MRASLNLLLIVALLSTMTGCCIGAARANRCVLCEPTAQCVRRQVWPPSQWCWGNCQLENQNEKLPGYLPQPATTPDVS